MTPHEYQQFALSTYCAPGHVDRTDYLHHLLIEEVGEVLSLFAKSMRDGHDVDRDRLVAELGDVLWCVAVIGEHECHWPQSLRWPRLLKRKNSNRARCEALDLMEVPDPVYFASFVMSCDPALTLEEIAIANVAKLTSRRDRGVLHGIGDHR